jgi:hypothetical protein
MGNPPWFFMFVVAGDCNGYTSKTLLPKQKDMWTVACHTRFCGLLPPNRNILGCAIRAVFDKRPLGATSALLESGSTSGRANSPVTANGHICAAANCTLLDHFVSEVVGEEERRRRGRAGGL